MAARAGSRIPILTEPMTDSTLKDDAPANSDLMLAVDLGGTHLRAATVDDRGNIHFRLRQDTPRTGRPEDIVNALVHAARQGEKQTTAEAGHIGVIAVALPGSVNVEAGRIVKVPNLPGLDGFPLIEALTSELGRPAMLENDANAAAVGEMWQGAGRGRRTIICVTLGTGVGGGIILNGRLWRGVNESAGEIGHMCVDPFGGVACTCGSNGCLEAYASATALVRMAREAMTRHPNSILRANQDLTSEEIYKAGVAGDELALEVFRRMGVYLGIGLANLINVLNPEMIVIGGGVVNGWELFAPDMQHQIAERTFSPAAAQVAVVRGECGDDAGLLGAARLAFDASNETS